MAKLTVLSDHATSPRAVVIHSVNASTDFAAVVNTILFPIAAFGAPFRTAVSLANKGISRIEALEAWAVRVFVGPGFIGSALDIMRLVWPSHPSSVFGSASADSPRAKRSDAGIEIRIIEGPGVGSNHQHKEDEVKDEKSNGSAIIVHRVK